MRTPWSPLVHCLGVTLISAGCHGPSAMPELHTLTGPTMGTTYTVKYLAPKQSLQEAEVQAAVEHILARITREFSTYDPDSELSRLNRAAAGEWLAVSQEMLQVMRKAAELNLLTGGAFDMTVGPLVALWGFGPNPPGEDRVPNKAELATAMRLVGRHNIELRLEPAAIKKAQAGVSLDLNALVPGYAADLVAARLEAFGFQHYLVDMGGELKLKGRNQMRAPWTVAIERPEPGTRRIERVIQLTDRGVATSGDYRNFFELGEQRYSHELDARTGWPIAHRLVSVTVIAGSAMHADGLATGLLVLGPEEGFALAEREHIAALFILRTSAGWEAQPTAAFHTYVNE